MAGVAGMFSRARAANTASTTLLPTTERRCPVREVASGSSGTQDARQLLAWLMTKTEGLTSPRVTTLNLGIAQVCYELQRSVQVGIEALRLSGFPTQDTALCLSVQADVSCCCGGVPACAKGALSVWIAAGECGYGENLQLETGIVHIPFPGMAIVQRELLAFLSPDD